MSQKVLVFGDIGIDDTVALLYGYFKEEIEIVQLWRIMETSPGKTL